MTVYVMTWHDRHIDDIISVHETLDGANEALDEQRDSYEGDGEGWTEIDAEDGEVVRSVHDESCDYWGDIRRIEVQP